MEKIITITSDFGYTDEYIGVMKGVILAIAPQVRIVDLTHGIAPQDIRQAALTIHSAYLFFPKERTIHVVVVDPGVGGARKIIAVSAKGHIFLAPDNGVLTLILQDPDLKAVYAVICEEIFLKPVSATFHGRDIFAPVAAHLAAGMKIWETGPLLSVNDLTLISFPQPVCLSKEGKIHGEIIEIDHFGNLTTNVSRNNLLHFFGERPFSTINVSVGGYTMDRISNTYQCVPQGRFVALFNRRDQVEIALNAGHAAKSLNAAIGLRVIFY